MTPKSYSQTAEELVDRIYALIPDHPEILQLEAPWKLFDFGLKVSDLQPSLSQASAALSMAQSRWRQNHGDAAAGK